jgi:type IV secretion system protein VirD4
LYRGNVLVLDPKAEHARKTFYRRGPKHPRARQTRYHFPRGRAYVLDPLHQAPDLPSVTCNLTVPIDVDGPRVRSLLSATSDACVLQEDPRNQHFVDMAALLLEGVIAHYASTVPKDQCSLPHICDRLLGIDPELGAADPARFDALLTDMRFNRVAGGIAQLAAAKLEAMGPNERGSVLSTLARSIKWITDPDMRAHLSGRNCCLPELVPGDPDEPVTIYVVLPLTYIREQARWMRTIVNIALTLIQNAEEPPRYPVLFVLDEFAQLGSAMRTVQQGIVTLRYANVTLWPVAQSISQIRAGLGAEWETFIAASTVQFFGVRDLATAQLASLMCGKDLHRRHEGRKFFGRRVAQEQPRELITPEEIMEEFGKDRPLQIVLPAGGGLPMRLARRAYKPLVVNGSRFKGLPLEGHFEE